MTHTKLWKLPLPYNLQLGSEILIEPIEEGPLNPELAEQFIRQSVSSIRGNVPTVTKPRVDNVSPRAESLPRAKTPARSVRGPQDLVLSEVGKRESPDLQERGYTPPRIDKTHEPLSVRSVLCPKLEIVKLQCWSKSAHRFVVLYFLSGPFFLCHCATCIMLFQ